MAVTTNPLGDPDLAVERFDRVERAVHWANAVVFFALLATGATLYLGDLAALVGHRVVVKYVHIGAGLLLPVPILAGVVTRHGAALRADLRRLNRWTEPERIWWSPTQRRRLRLGKFNRGQKANAAFVGGAYTIMSITGLVMWQFEPFPLSWREGATFTHDVFAWALATVAFLHVVIGLNNSVARHAMWRGDVPATWARRYRPAWYDELVAGGPDADQR
jgi:formate dehydrogenase subunit gamma